MKKKTTPSPSPTADRLRRAIRESGMTPYAICKATSIPQSALSRFIHGKQSLRLVTAEKLMELFGLAVESVSA